MAGSLTLSSIRHLKCVISYHKKENRRVTHLFNTKLAFSLFSLSGLFKEDAHVWVLSLLPFLSEFCLGTVAGISPACRTGVGWDGMGWERCWVRPRVPGTAAAASAPERGAGTIKYAWGLLQQTNLFNWKEWGSEKWNLAVQLLSTIWWLLWDSSKGSYHCGHNLLDFKDPYEFWRHTK